jgi:hypothetical protein
MYNRECTQALERAMEKVEGIKEDVKAFIVLAVTDEESLDGTAKTGVNAVCGECDEILNLLANLPDELILKFALAKTNKVLETLLKEENHDKENTTIN